MLAASQDRRPNAKLPESWIPLAGYLSRERDLARRDGDMCPHRPRT